MFIAAVVVFGNPAALGGWVMVGLEIGGDLVDEGRETLAPIAFFGIEGAVAGCYPGNVVWGVGADGEGWLFGAHIW